MLESGRKIFWLAEFDRKNVLIIRIGLTETERKYFYCQNLNIIFLTVRIWPKKCFDCQNLIGRDWTKLFWLSESKQNLFGCENLSKKILIGRNRPENVLIYKIWAKIFGLLESDWNFFDTQNLSENIVIDRIWLSESERNYFDTWNFFWLSEYEWKYMYNQHLNEKYFYYQNLTGKGIHCENACENIRSDRIWPKFYRLTKSEWKYYDYWEMMTEWKLFRLLESDRFFLIDRIWSKIFWMIEIKWKYFD